MNLDNLNRNLNQLINLMPEIDNISSNFALLSSPNNELRKDSV